jgi:hypothetical protein
VSDNFVIEPRILHRKIFSLLKAGHCALLHLAFEPDFRMCSPHKLFEYMAAGLPVIVSPAESVARIVREEGAGIVVGYNPAEMAQAIIELAKDKDLRNRMGEAGKKAVREKYNWKNDSQILINIYDRFLRKSNAV